MIAQRTTDWHRQRLGRITASEFHVLMKNRKVAMTEEELAMYKAENPKSRTTTKEVPFSEATFTYLNRKVMERYIPKDGSEEIYIDLHDISNRAMGYGTDTEPLARRCYAERMGYEVLEVEFESLEGFNEICGASADGIVRYHNGGVELKCPYGIEHHMENLLMENVEDLFELRNEYYWQMRLCMLVWNTEWWDFVSFCPYISASKQLKVIRMYRDKSIDESIIERLTIAKEYMMRKITELNEINSIIK